MNAMKNDWNKFEYEHVLDLVLHKYNDSRLFISINEMFSLSLESDKFDVLLLVMFPL